MDPRELEILDMKLARQRRRIDGADRKLLAALAVRFKAVVEVARIKRELSAPVLQKSRWAALKRDRLGIARALGLDPRFVAAMLELIHAESLRQQRTIGQKRTPKKRTSNKSRKKRKK